MKTVISGSDKVVILFGTYGLPALQLTPCDVVMIKNFTLGPSVVLGVIYNFIHKMMQAFIANIANIHRGALSYCFKAFKNLYTVGAIAI